MKTNIKLPVLYIAYLLIVILGGKLSAHFHGIAQRTYLGNYAILSVAVLAVTAALLVLVIIFRTLLNTRAGYKGSVIMAVVFTAVSAALLVCSCIFASPLYMNLSLSPDCLSLALTMLLTSDIFDLVVQLRNKNKKGGK